jgi:hypothetical protein
VRAREALAGTGSTAFVWVQASWNNAKILLPDGERAGWRGGDRRSSLATRKRVAREASKEAKAPRKRSALNAPGRGHYTLTRDSGPFFW